MTPDGWRETSLGEIARVEIGRTPARKEKSYWDPEKTTNNRWATIRDVKSKFVGETAEHISEIGVRHSRAQLVPTGTLLMSFKLTLGRAAITSYPMYTNEALAAFYHNNGASTEYLYYLLPNLALEESSDRAVKGRTLNKGKLRALRLLLPPLSEQRKIAAILSSVDNAIEKAQAVIDQMQVVKRGLMQELLTRGLPVRHRAGVGELSDGWSLKHIGELGEVVTGSTPSTKRHAYWNGTVPFVTPSDLGKIKRINGTGRYVTEEGLAQVREIPPGAVMVTCIGATIGKLGIAEKKCCTNQQINSIIPNISIVLTEYLYYAMSFASNALAGIAGTTAVPIVSKNHFVRFGLTIPPLAEQEEIAKVLAGVDQFVDANEAYQTKLTEMKVGLLSVLLTGELRVTPDPEPE